MPQYIDPHMILAHFEEKIGEVDSLYIYKYSGSSYVNLPSTAHEGRGFVIFRQDFSLSPSKIAEVEGSLHFIEGKLYSLGLKVDKASKTLLETKAKNEKRQLHITDLNFRVSLVDLYARLKEKGKILRFRYTSVNFTGKITCYVIYEEKDCALELEGSTFEVKNLNYFGPEFNSTENVNLDPEDKLQEPKYFKVTLSVPLANKNLDQYKD